LSASLRRRLAARFAKREGNPAASRASGRRQSRLPFRAVFMPTGDGRDGRLQFRAAVRAAYGERPRCWRYPDRRRTRGPVHMRHHKLPAFAATVVRDKRTALKEAGERRLTWDTQQRPNVRIVLIQKWSRLEAPGNRSTSFQLGQCIAKTVRR
jgi:hypothetical protein